MSAAFLGEMAWKSTLLIAVALLLLALLRQRSAADRSLVLRLAVALLLALPMTALFGPDLAIEKPAVLRDFADAPPAAAKALPEIHGAVATAVSTAPAAAVSGPRLSFGSPQALLVAWLLGVFAVLGQLAAGLWTLRRWTAASRPIHHPLWAAAYDRALHRARPGRPVALRVADDVPAPLGWGLRRPVILVDRATLARDEQAEAILEHEMAHVARGDWPMLMVARLAVALFWFNPLAWLLHRKLVEESEAAADMHAVGRLDPALYADALLSCAGFSAGRLLPATPMVARTGIGRRIHAVLDDQARARRSGSVWTALACTAALSAALTIAALELIPAARASAASVSRPAPVPVAQAAPVAEVAAPAEAVVADEASAQPMAVAVTATAMDEVPAPPLPPLPPVAPASPVAPAAPEPPMPPAPPSPIDPDDLAAMRAMGVTPAFMAEVAAARGIEGLSIDDAVELKALGVTPDGIRAMAAAGYPRLSVDDLTEFAALGVTADWVRGLAAAGFRNLSVDSLVELKAMGVTPAFAERARRTRGITTADDLVELKATGGL
jgi:beta-lactamase regulating signal transducer with metallopeptidase domain